MPNLFDEMDPPPRHTTEMLRELRTAVEPAVDPVHIAARNLTYADALKFAAEKFHVTKFVAQNADGTFTGPAAPELIVNILNASGGHRDLGKNFSVTDRGTVVGCGLEYKPIAVKTSKNGPELEFSGPVIDKAADALRSSASADPRLPLRWLNDENPFEKKGFKGID